MSQIEKVLEQIANNKIGIETLQTRNNDNLDVHSVDVYQLKQALMAAFEAGRAAAAKKLEA